MNAYYWLRVYDSVTGKDYIYTRDIESGEERLRAFYPPPDFFATGWWVGDWVLSTQQEGGDWVVYRAPVAQDKDAEPEPYEEAYRFSAATVAALSTVPGLGFRFAGGVGDFLVFLGGDNIGYDVGKLYLIGADGTDRVVTLHRMTPGGDVPENFNSAYYPNALATFADGFAGLVSSGGAF